MANKYTGRKTLVIGDKSCSLVYDWDALAEFETEYEDSNILTRLNTASLDDLLKITLIGLKKNNPEITADQIKANFPGKLVLAKAIDAAMLYAYHGTDNAEKILADLEALETSIEAQTNKGQSPKKKTR